MAPEQIEGDAVDARTDIFSFGVVLYEMLTGRKAFTGKTEASVLSAILKDQPPPVSAVAPVVPRALDYLVRTCLAKDPADRFQSAHDLLLQLRWIAEADDAAAVPAPVAARRRSRERLAWTAAAVFAAIAVAGGAVAVTHLREAQVTTDPVQFAIASDRTFVLPPTPMGVVSPDGRLMVVPAAIPGQGTGMLWVETLASRTTSVLPGTEGASSPFWSPDSHAIAFYARGKLRKLDVRGGAPTELCDAAAGNAGAGGTWSRSHTIVFSPSTGSPLNKVDEKGGTPVPVTAIVDKGETHRFPSFLPDGRHFLYFVLKGGVRELRVGSVDAPDSVAVGAADSNAIYASGHLLFARAGRLVAQPFDLATNRTRGDPFPVAERVYSSLNGRASFSVSETGVLAYFGGGDAVMSQLTWFDRNGNATGVVGAPGAYTNMSLSPDERRVAVSMTSGAPPNRDIWVIDLARAGTTTRLTDSPAVEADPIWSPDGSQILFNSNRDNGQYNSAFLRSSDFSGGDVPVLKMDRLVDSPDWSHNGKFLVFTGGLSQTSNDLWMLPLSGPASERKATPLLEAPFNQDSPAFSPDDRWIAYDSDASANRFEVLVRSSSPGGGQTAISRDGGWAPKWRADGKEIFFLALDGAMMAADVTLGTDVHAGLPHKLFQTGLLRSNDKHTYAVTKNGQRFLMAVRDPRQAPIRITVVINWLAMARQNAMARQ